MDFNESLAKLLQTRLHRHSGLRLRGDVRVTFEEGTWAAWLYDLLKPHVSEVVVCNPRKNALLKNGSPIRAALLIALIQTPHRFRTKRQPWTYSGLGLETQDSAPYRVVEGQLQRSEKPVTLRGLNQDHNHDLKDISKCAATRVSSSSHGPLHDFYEHLLAQGRKPKMARLTVARKIAAITLIVWKKEVHFRRQLFETTNSVSALAEIPFPSLEIIPRGGPSGSRDARFRGEYPSGS